MGTGSGKTQMYAPVVLELIALLMILYLVLFSEFRKS
jgi:hypothetical protein